MRISKKEEEKAGQGMPQQAVSGRRFFQELPAII
jgi:hypothetical protein